MLKNLLKIYSDTTSADLERAASLFHFPLFSKSARFYLPCHAGSLIVCSFTHFLFLKMKLNTRHTTAKTMPAVAKMEKMTVRERSTDTSSSVGTPSCEATPPEKWR